MTLERGEREREKKKNRTQSIVTCRSSQNMNIHDFDAIVRSAFHVAITKFSFWYTLALFPYQLNAISLKRLEAKVYRFHEVKRTIKSYTNN